MTNLCLWWFLQRSDRQITAPPCSHWSTGVMPRHSYRWFHHHRQCWWSYRGVMVGSCKGPKIGWVNLARRLFHPPSPSQRSHTHKEQIHQQNHHVRCVVSPCSTSPQKPSEGSMDSSWSAYSMGADISSLVDSRCGRNAASSTVIVRISVITDLL